jgi:hypothetical protein
MTVRDYIKKLQAMPQDYEVVRTRVPHSQDKRPLPRVEFTTVMDEGLHPHDSSMWEEKTIRVVAV